MVIADAEVDGDDAFDGADDVVVMVWLLMVRFDDGADDGQDCWWW